MLQTWVARQGRWLQTSYWAQQHQLWRLCNQHHKQQQLMIHLASRLAPHHHICQPQLPSRCQQLRQGHTWHPRCWQPGSRLLLKLAVT